MGDRYWVGTDTNWHDDNNWALTSGGAGGAGIPTGSDDVYFDAVFLQDLEHPDVGEPARRARRKHQSQLTTAHLAPETAQVGRKLAAVPGFPKIAMDRPADGVFDIAT